MVFFVGLLTLSAEENKTIDELPYLTPEEKKERMGGNCTPPAIEQFPEPLMGNFYRHDFFKDIGARSCVS